MGFEAVLVMVGNNINQDQDLVKVLETDGLKGVSDIGATVYRFI